jgi:hypothetical protein
MEDHKISTTISVEYKHINQVRRLSKERGISTSSWIRQAITEKLDRDMNVFAADLQSEK